MRQRSALSRRHDVYCGNALFGINAASERSAAINNGERDLLLGAALAAHIDGIHAGQSQNLRQRFGLPAAPGEIDHSVLLRCGRDRQRAAVSSVAAHYFDAAVARMSCTVFCAKILLSHFSPPRLLRSCLFRCIRLLRPQIHFPLQSDALPFFDPSRDQFCSIPGHEIRDEARREIPYREREHPQSARQHAVRDSQPQKQLRRVDVLEDSAVRVAMVTRRGKICRLVLFRQIPSHRDRHGVSQDNRGQKRQHHVAEQRVGTTLRRYFFHPCTADQAGHCIEKDQKQEHLRKELGKPGQELGRPCVNYFLDYTYEKHRSPTEFEDVSACGAKTSGFLWESACGAKASGFPSGKAASRIKPLHCI